MSISSVGQLNQILMKGDMKSWASESSSRLNSNLNDPARPLIDIETGAAIKTSDSHKLDPSKGNFVDFLKDSLVKVNDLQGEANKAMELLASGDSSQGLHETMLAVEQAEIAFKTMNQIRTKVLEAYREVMRMQI